MRPLRYPKKASMNARIPAHRIDTAAPTWLIFLITLAILTGVAPRIDARTLDCGAFEFPNCAGTDHQFDRKFKGREAF
jgi:hypothetical protein